MKLGQRIAALSLVAAGIAGVGAAPASAMPAGSTRLQPQSSVYIKTYWTFNECWYQSSLLQQQGYISWCVSRSTAQGTVWDLWAETNSPTS